MKILLAGSTGFIGREVLDQCLQHPSITSIVALSRRPLEVQSPKLSVAITDSFLEYNEEVRGKLEGVKGCIWCLGKAWMPSNEQAREVCVDYTMAAVNILTTMYNNNNNNSNYYNHSTTTADSTAPVLQKKKEKLRFIYLSGGAAERDQSKPLWFKQDYRRIRGSIESLLLTHARINADVFEAHIMRPGMVLAKEANLRDLVRGLGPSVQVERLAEEMIRRVVGKEVGTKEGRNKEAEGFIVENKEINRGM